MDGSQWKVVPEGEPAAGIVLGLAAAMQLAPQSGPARLMLVCVKEQQAGSKPLGGAVRSREDVPRDVTGSAPRLASPAWRVSSPGDEQKVVVCALDPEGDEGTALQLVQLSLAIASWAEDRGGLLLHGALAEHDGRGAILAGPGGVGKTTASRRLPPSWRSLSDDVALVVRGVDGKYWAHPWPTWSRFMFGGPCGSWDVQHAVPL